MGGESGKVLGPENRVAHHRNNGEVGPQQPIGSEVAGEVLERARGGDDQDACIPRDRWKRGAAPLEHQQPRAPRCSDRDRLDDVGVERRSRESPSGPPCPDGRDPRGQSVLEVVARGVVPGAGDLEQSPEAHAPRLHDLRLCRTAAAHGDHDRVPAETRSLAGHLTGDGRLARALAGPDHGERRHALGRRCGDGRRETEVRPLVHGAGGEHRRGDLHPFPVAEDRLVREVEHRPSLEVVEGGRHRPTERSGHDLEGHAEIGDDAGPELLGAADEERAHHVVTAVTSHVDGVAHHRRVMLTIHEDEGPYRIGHGGGTGGVSAVVDRRGGLHGLLAVGRRGLEEREARHLEPTAERELSIDPDGPALELEHVVARLRMAAHA